LEQPIDVNLEHLKLNLQLLIIQIQLELMHHHLLIKKFLFFKSIYYIPINNDAAKIDTTLTIAFVRIFKSLDFPVNNAQRANVPPLEIIIIYYLIKNKKSKPSPLLSALRIKTAYFIETTRIKLQIIRLTAPIH